MAKQLTPSEVSDILQRGTFDELVGALEDEHLECKGAPYQLQQEHQKYELAKDVSMVVNRSARSGGEGGHILLGVRTEPSLEYHADMVAEVRPFDRGLVNPKQYHDNVSGSAPLEGHILPPVLFLFPGTCDASRLATAVRTWRATKENIRSSSRTPAARTRPLVRLREGLSDWVRNSSERIGRMYRCLY